jgi:hypothetical protein
MATDLNSFKPVSNSIFVEQLLEDNQYSSAEEIRADSTLRKRKLKMNKHKLRKRRKQIRNRTKAN